jgi:hypothetical protein
LKGRKLIEYNIKKAWEQCIKKDYTNKRINSERSLQASFWSYLNKLLPDDQRLFIEPRVAVGSKKLYPDVVVCRKKLVTAIIELKYLPRTKPNYSKDIKTLAFISNNRDKTSISNKRYQGEIKVTEYKLSKRILFVYACVHKDLGLDEYALYAASHKSLNGCYLQLHAETNEIGKPRVFCLESF